jgi:hypothetical protein
MHEYLHGYHQDLAGPRRLRFLNTPDDLGLILYYLESQKSYQEEVMFDFWMFSHQMQHYHTRSRISYFADLVYQ